MTGTGNRPLEPKRYGGSMKKLAILTIILMFSGFLTTSLLAAQNSNAKQAQQGQKAQQGQNVNNGNQEQNKALKLENAYFKKREEAKARRDQAMKLRSRNIMNNNPGNTGM